MSLQLRLLPFDGEFFSQTIMEAPIYREDGECLEAAIDALPQLEVPGTFHTFLATDKRGENCYGNTQETPYGDQLKHTTMKHLKTIGFAGPVGAYVAASPDDQKCALYWF